MTTGVHCPGFPCLRKLFLEGAPAAAAALLQPAALLVLDKLILRVRGSNERDIEAMRAFGAGKLGVTELEMCVHATPAWRSKLSSWLVLDLPQVQKLFFSSILPTLNTPRLTGLSIGWREARARVKLAPVLCTCAAPHKVLVPR